MNPTRCCIWIENQEWPLCSPSAIHGYVLMLSTSTTFQISELTAYGIAWKGMVWIYQWIQMQMCWGECARPFTLHFLYKSDLKNFFIRSLFFFFIVPKFMGQMRMEMDMERKQEPKKERNIKGCFTVKFNEMFY